MTKAQKKPTCGIVMPISEICYREHTYTVEHWSNVYDLIRDAATDAGFEARMVSHADGANIIQKTIVQNLYQDDVVVCDISAKNSNVMFEFGLRCAFDKPVVVIKDKETGFSFDTSPFKHIEYFRELGYKEIKALQSKLATCIEATFNESKVGKKSPFLESFGEFVPKKMVTTELNHADFIIQQLKEIKSQINAMKPQVRDNELLIKEGSIKLSADVLKDSDGWAVDAETGERGCGVEFMDGRKVYI